jgi:hypothetical protein
MSVWVCVPSKRPPAEVEKWAQVWRDMGYKVLIGRDDTVKEWGPIHYSGGAGVYMWPMDAEGQRRYPGYAQATNTLISYAINTHPGARWFVIGGDDVFPDTTKRADEIADECLLNFSPLTGRELREHGTFGVMQPTGDRWGDKQGPYIERVAGSAWIGREFALRAYGGNGPLWHEYQHMYADEELQLVAQKLGVFWQRPDLTQIHQHWGRPREGETMGLSERIPDFLKEANSGAHWKKYRAIFEARKAAGFPGHEVKV